MKIEKNHCIALIPARGGSKGVPHKNIKLLKEFPLIAYTITTALMSEKIQRVIVSTDSLQIAEISKTYGAEVPFLRPLEFATDSSGDMEFVKHAIKWLAENEGQLPEYLVHLRPTTPLRDVTIVDEAIQQFKINIKADSLRSAHKAPESPYKWFQKNQEGYFESLINGMNNEEINQARQCFPEAYIPDGYVDILRTECILEKNCLYGDRMMAFETPFCQEADIEEDFMLLEYMLDRFNYPLVQYMRSKH